jgi:hypothetical protein
MPALPDYTTQVATLNPDHSYSMDGNANDGTGSANGTNSGGIFTEAAIAEDATNCYTVNGLTDRVTLPTTTTINNSAQTQKCVAGWFETTAFQAPPSVVYGEGDNATNFQFVFGFGNNLLFECTEPTNFPDGLQIYGPPFVPNRIYHICGIFLGNSNGNEVKLFVDGVEQTNADPTDRQPDTADLNSRGVGIFGDPSGTVGIGGDVVLQQAAHNGRYNHWYIWDGADADLTDTEIRETLFELGALAGSTISTGTEAAMQTSLDALADSVRPDEPLNIRVEEVTGDGDVSLDADNITHNSLASIHVQYLGSGTLTWRNTNGSNASIGSTPNGGTITFATPVNLTITCLDAATNAVIEGARVLMEADSGGPLTSGTDILTGATNASGQITGTFDYTSDQPVTGRIRKGTSSPYYVTAAISSTITSSGLDITIFMVPDE